MLKSYNLFTESFLFGTSHKRGQNYSWYDVKDIDFSQEPTTLEDTIKFAIKWYPTLYHGINARERALESIFLEIGGNYDWDIDGRRSQKYEGDENDIGMITKRKENYDWEYRVKERQKEIEQLKKDIISYKETIEDNILTSKELSDKGDNIKAKKFIDSNEFWEKSLKRGEKELEELIKHDTEFDPHYHRFMPQPEDSDKKPIDKIPWSIDIKKVNNIPDNAQRDFVEGFYEIIDFFCQKQFKNDDNFNTIKQMREALKKKFTYLK